MNRFVLSLSALLFAATASNAAPIFSDPVGDVFGGTNPDIVSYSGDLPPGGSTYTFTVNFLNPISPFSAFAANSVFGYLDFDTDRNAATGGNSPWGANQPGGNSWINFAVANGFLAGPPIALGDEFFIDLSTESGGLVGLFRTSDNTQVALVPISFGSNSFTIDIPASALGNPGQFNYGIYAGGVADFAGDRAPNGAAPAVTTPEPASAAVPEPASAAVFGLLCAAAGGYFRHRRPRPTAARPV